MVNFKIQKLQVTIHRLLTSILQKDFKNTSLANLNIIEVKLTSDYSIATIYYSSLVTNNEEPLIADILKENMWSIRQKLAKQLTIFKVPQLVFTKDELINNSMKIENILKGLKKE